LTSRKGSGLSRPNLDLDHANVGLPGRLRWFEVQFKRLLEVGKSFFFGFALAGNVEFQALRDVPFALTPNSSREWSLHISIISQGGVLRTVAAIRSLFTREISFGKSPTRGLSARGGKHLRGSRVFRQVDCLSPNFRLVRYMSSLKGIRACDLLPQ
jgi:hypothetical protein